MNKWGIWSIAMALINYAVIWLVSGTSFNILAVFFVLAALTIAGFVFAFMSKKAVWILIGVIMNLIGSWNVLIALVAYGMFGAEPG